MPEYINPNGETVRIASTSGHVVFIGDDPVNILPHMEAEARAKGCLPLTSYRALEEKIKADMAERMAGKSGQTEVTGEADQKVAGNIPAAAGPGPGDDQNLKKVVEAIELMLDADGDDYFTGGGLPRAAKVSELAGFEVSKELREKAWDLVKQEAAK